MKTQLASFSVHQNAKVFAVLMAVSSIVFLIPFALVFSFSGAKGAGFPLPMFLIFPVMYLAFGYVMVAVGCWVYNILAKYIGGFEFESRNIEI